MTFERKDIRPAIVSEEPVASLDEFLTFCCLFRNI
jgi:hypothetical protein|tara:strand:+ start:32388 stop:32492 length:105 start_codon:yes stop_codon:yes gene_type:complete